MRRSTRNRRAALTVEMLAALAVLGLTISGGTFTSPSTASVAAPHMVPSWWTGTTALVPRGLSGTSGTATFHDSTYTSLSSGATVTDVRLTDQADLSCPYAYAVTYAETNLAAPTGGLFPFASAGSWTITATTTNQTRTFTGTATSNSSTAYTWSGNATNSVAGAENATIDGELAGRTFSTSAPRWSSYSVSPTNMAGNTFTPNTNLWTALNLTPVSAYNSSAYDTFGFQVTAISPRHVLTANHVAPAHGTQYNFVGASGTVYTRSIVSTANPSGDICIGCLNVELPADVTPARVLPSNYGSYLSLNYASTTYPMRVRCYYFDQSGKIDCTELSSGTPGYGFFDGVPGTSQGAAFYQAPYSGDSSCPVLMKINGTTVVIFARYTVNAGPSVADAATAVNAAMASESAAAGLTPGETNNGSAYQLTPVSLSVYGTF